MSLSNDPQYQLFFDTHYYVKVEQSLRPSFAYGRMNFPTRYYYVRKYLTILDKLRYYLQDLILWFKTNR